MKKKESWLDKISLDFSKIMLVNIIINGLFLLFGAIVYLNPVKVVNVVGIVLGIYFILFGIFAIYEFLIRKVAPMFFNKIFLGVLAIFLGVFTIINPFHIVKILTFALGIYLSIVALFKGIEAYYLKKCGYEGWLLQFVISIMLLVFGIFIAINPMASMDIISATGIFIILGTILEICNLVMLYSKAKDIVKLIKNTEKRIIKK